MAQQQASAAAPAAPNAAQVVALAMRDFVNARTQDEAQVEQFMQKIGGYATLFGLVVAISDSLHLQLVRRVLARLFDSSLAGRARLCSPEVAEYLKAGLHADQLKHVKLTSLQQTHLFILDQQGQERLGDDVEITEEVSTLLRQLGATQPGMEKLLSPRTLDMLFRGVMEGSVDSGTKVVDTEAQGEGVMAPFMQIMQAQHAAADASSSSSAARPSVNSVLLLRVLTLLTHIACGTRLKGDAAAVAAVAGGGAAASSSAPAPLADASPALRAQAWDLYERQGLFGLLLHVSSIAPPGSGQDMLVQLNGLELLEEIVRSCPKLDDQFATRLTQQLLSPAVGHIKRVASEGAVAEDATPRSLIPTSSFVTVGLLRVFNALASVSSARDVHAWYHEESFLLFLSAAMNEYDAESVQAEAMDLLATLGSFAEGLAFFSAFTSSLPVAAVSQPAASASYLSDAYASAVTPVLLCQLPYFVYGSNYSNGLRQLAALHGIAKVLGTKYPAEEQEEAEGVGLYGAGDSAAAPASAATAAAASPSQLLRHFFQQLSSYNRGRPALDVLLVLAKQPFEDIREAVWKVMLALVQHAWGVSLVCSSGGLLEYLLDRRTEFHVSGTRAKYDVLRALDASPHASSYMQQSMRAQVHEYVRQGAHYAPLTVGVMAPVSQFK